MNLHDPQPPATAGASAATSPRPFAPSPHQARVFAFVRAGKGHGVVMATAGSGKTTTLVQVARLLPRQRRACFLAFNRATAAELRARLPAHVDATTIHALGRAALLAAFPHASGRRQGMAPQAGKYLALARAVTERHAARLPAEPEPVARYLARLADMVRLELAPPASPAAVARVARTYALEAPATAATVGQIHALLPDLLRAGRAAAAEGNVDYTDMLYLPAVLQLALPPYGFVCVDEAQDLSRAALALVLRLVTGGARALFVGDERQAIYAFAGADERSLARIVERTAATVMPLSVSYRCPRRHVALARRFAPRMEGAPGAVLGSVWCVAEARLPRCVGPGDLLLARTNAPLVGACLRLARAGIAARVLGDDLVPAFRALADRVLPPHDLRHARARVRRAARVNATRLEQALLTHPALAASLRRSADAHAALDLLLEALETTTLRPTRRHLDALVDRLFASDGGVLLSTVHKAKGREAERVFLLHPEELATAEADAAERNVLFVALTRARRELVLVERVPGAIRARLRAANARGEEAARRAPPTGPPDTDARAAGPAEPTLERAWNDVLGLAMVMARQRR